MRREFYDHHGKELIKIDNAKPECDKDFCDTCGDCLSCYGCDPCFDDGEHQWVIYESKNLQHRKG